MDWLRYLGLRVGRVLVVVFGLAVVVFVLTRTLTDPVDVILGPESSQDQRDRLNAVYGFDKPLWEQFVIYLGDLVRGDFGRSISLDRPALDAILERLPASLLLATSALLLALVFGLVLGIAGGLRPGSLIDRVSVAVSSLSVSVPDFWLGLTFINLFAVQFQWFPTGGYGGWTDLEYLVLPAVTMALLPTGRLSRVVRESVIEEMSKDYVLAARSRGLSRATIMRRHVLRNVSVAATSVIGFDYLLIFSGFGASLEVVYGWPGIGRLAIQATLATDVILVSALVVVTGIIVGIGNVLLDMVHALIDRRLAR